MSAGMTLKAVLWDFGDTLADQDWMLRPPENFPDWPNAWNEIARGSAEHDWYVNEVTYEQIAARVSKLLGMSVADVMDHIRDCCTNIRFFDSVMIAAINCPLPKAIVTVNPDIFTKFVVPRYQLVKLFPIIITSWQEASEDKATLCAKALKKLGIREPGEALLIDNNAEAVRDWQNVGGQTYLFEGEDKFVANLKTSLKVLQ